MYIFLEHISYSEYINISLLVRQWEISHNKNIIIIFKLLKCLVEEI